MRDLLLAYDFGTGGIKASLYEANGTCRADSFERYETLYPRQGCHEQRPQDWWLATVLSTQNILKKDPSSRERIAAIGISGHSLGVVALGSQGELLRETTPIWSDSRPSAQQTEPFFQAISEEAWYLKTGCGFPAQLYSIFKLMWFHDNEPEMFKKISTVIGTKDYINFRLTGVACTDNSYASGSGVYDLARRAYDPNLISASGISPELFPRIVPSTEILGTLTKMAAQELGLDQAVKVVAGGVDNSCMALGAGAFRNGRIYNSLGSSSWIAVSSDHPVLDTVGRPYVFDHVVPGQYVSATAIFSAGTSHNWVREQLCRDLILASGQDSNKLYRLMAEEAASSPVGARNLIFNPSLAGGSSLDPTPKIRGSFTGLDLQHRRSDIIRATMEGVALGLRLALDKLAEHAVLGEEMVVVGGGAECPLWRQIFADIYKKKIVKLGIGQQAAALGAAALAAVGSGVWDSFDRLEDIQKVSSTETPVEENSKVYEAILLRFKKVIEYHGELANI